MYGYHYEKHLVLNQKMVCLWQEEDGEKTTEAWILPEHGANLCRFRVDGVDYLYPAPAPVFDTQHYGTPVLYPFPGVMTGCEFSFDEKLYRFPANRGDVYRHGYVMGEKFAWAEPVVTEDSVSMKTSFEVNHDHPLYALFPISNRLDIQFTLTKGKVTIDIQVENLSRSKRLPFGFGLHPYLNLIGARENITVEIPMKQWLSREKAALLPPHEAPVDFSNEISLENVVIDEVWTGMVPSKPQVLRYHEIQKQFIVEASELFTHGVTYCPEGADYICLENWTSSHDPHNLYAAGHHELSHLIILPPGEMISGQVSYTVAPIA